MTPLEHHDRVADDIATAEDKLDGRRPGRGMAFRRALAQAFVDVGDTPLRYGREEGEYRAYHLEDFGYILWYLAEESRVWVAAVAHERQSRDFLGRRMPPP